MVSSPSSSPSSLSPSPKTSSSKQTSPTASSSSSPLRANRMISSPLASSSPVSAESNASSDEVHLSIRSRSQGLSTSSLNPTKVARARSDSAASSSSTTSFRFDITGTTPTPNTWDLPKSSFREKNSSPSNSASPPSLYATFSPSEVGMTLPDASASVWWHEVHPQPRPWITAFTVSSFKPLDAEKPANEQESNWVRCRKLVANATATVLPYVQTAGDIVHEALYVGVDFLELAPIPGLAPAAKLLLEIWDALQMVDINRLASLRLTERCADILLSVRLEINEAGDHVAEELGTPIKRLVTTFQNIHDLLLKQSNRPFLKRYLKREDILAHIQACDTVLTDALGMFGISIQIRILKQVQAYEIKRTQDTKKENYPSGVLGISFDEREEDQDSTLDSLVGLPDLSSTTPSSTVESPTTSIPTIRKEVPTVDDPTSYETTSPTIHLADLQTDDIMKELTEMRKKQNEEDRRVDMVDLRGLMRAALQTNSDQDLVTVLQVGRDEMPEAIKTLQRALESVLERERSDTSLPAESTSDTPSSSIPGVLARGAKLTRKLTARSKKSVSPRNEPPMKLQKSQTMDHERSEKRGIVKRTNTHDTALSSVQSTNRSVGSSLTRHTSLTTASKDTLHREFIETGIDALRRVSGPTAFYDEEYSDGDAQGNAVGTLPSWTITKYEVDRDIKIGFGFFSDVFRGTWRGRTVAIKVLADTTPRNLFIREVTIWKTLKHRNVLELYGASSTTGDPPWFFVSPYLKRGPLSQFLRRKAMQLAAASKSSSRSRGQQPTKYSRPTAAPNSRGHQSSPSLPNNLSSSTSFSTATLSPLSMERGRSESLGSQRGRSISPPSRRAITESVVDSTDNKSPDLLRFMHEIARGMQYLHSNGVLHGDLKAANVLVDDKFRCVITDFGQSEMKSEAYRISGTTQPHGTLRWQSPELMLGSSILTPQVDVYAFSMTIVEILSMGRIPWPLHDDTEVRRFILVDHARPPIPLSNYNSIALDRLITQGWDNDPSVRPSFEKIAGDVRYLRTVAGNVSSKELRDEETGGSSTPRLDWENRPGQSPDLNPIPLPDNSAPVIHSILGTSPLSNSDPNSTIILSRNEDTVRSGRRKHSETVVYTPSRSTSVSTSSTNTDDCGTSGSDGRDDYEGHVSPPPANDSQATRMDEMRYRMHLNHENHPSLVLPLWSPSHLPLCTVGYLQKPEGTFVPLMNALKPQNSNEPSIRNLPSIYGYGIVNEEGRQRIDKRNVALRSLDALAGFLTFKGRGEPSEPVSRRISFPLRAGHRAACLAAETTLYRYMDNLESSKKWFMANVDTVLQEFGTSHRIGKEDLFMVIGALDAPEWGVFVSHRHPSGQVHFNVYASPPKGGEWGSFSTDTTLPEEMVGPTYNDTTHVKSRNNSKVSRGKSNGEKWDTLLVARLRFKPDSIEPTSL